MARPRKPTTARSRKAKPKAAAKSRATASRKRQRTSSRTGTFTCPECGRAFARAAALGAHRRTHGVVGATATARNAGRPTSTDANSVGTGRRRGRPPGSGRRSVNRDALLAALFPQGVPPREGVIRAVNRWLDDAESLARMR